MNLGDLAGFNRFIAPTLIKIAYWVGIVCIVISGLGSLFASHHYGLFAGFTGFIIQLVLIILGLLFWRVLCESAILLFGMHERLGIIRDRLSASSRDY